MAAPVAIKMTVWVRVKGTDQAKVENAAGQVRDSFRDNADIGMVTSAGGVWQFVVGLENTGAAQALRAILSAARFSGLVLESADDAVAKKRPNGSAVPQHERSGVITASLPAVPSTAPPAIPPAVSSVGTQAQDAGPGEAASLAAAAPPLALPTSRAELFALTEDQMRDLLNRHAAEKIAQAMGLKVTTLLVYLREHPALRSMSFGLHSVGPREGHIVMSPRFIKGKRGGRSKKPASRKLKDPIAAQLVESVRGHLATLGKAVADLEKQKAQAHQEIDDRFNPQIVDAKGALQEFAEQLQNAVQQQAVSSVENGR